jgi:hypothetical protein
MQYGQQGAWLATKLLDNLLDPFDIPLLL